MKQQRQIVEEQQKKEEPQIPLADAIRARIQVDCFFLMLKKFFFYKERTIITVYFKLYYNKLCNYTMKRRLSPTGTKLNIIKVEEGKFCNANYRKFLIPDTSSTLREFIYDIELHL